MLCGLLTFHCQRCAHPITHTYLFGDVAVLINVIEVKGPVKLLSNWTSEQHRQANDKVLKSDRTISVDVKRVEQEVSVGGCICRQKMQLSQLEWGGGLDLIFDSSELLIFVLGHPLVTEELW